MSIYHFNKGLDDVYNGSLPNEKLMQDSRDYFDGYSMGEDINERHNHDREMEKQYYEQMENDYYNYCMDCEYLGYLVDLNNSLLEDGFECYEIRNF